MTAKNHSTSNSPNPQDTDAAIVAMLDRMLLNDDMYIISADDGVHLMDLTDETDFFGRVIDTYETRAAAYRAGIDCIIELSIEGWERGGAK